MLPYPFPARNSIRPVPRNGSAPRHRSVGHWLRPSPMRRGKYPTLPPGPLSILRPESPRSLRCPFRCPVSFCGESRPVSSVPTVPFRRAESACRARGGKSGRRTARIRSRIAQVPMPPAVRGLRSTPFRAGKDGCRRLSVPVFRSRIYPPATAPRPPSLRVRRTAEPTGRPTDYMFRAESY